VLPILAGVVIGAVLLIAYTWHMLALLALTYIASIPVGIRNYRRQHREWEARSGKTRELDAEPVRSRGADRYVAGCRWGLFRCRSPPRGPVLPQSHPI
jgi:hypothetical protein